MTLLLVNQILTFPTAKTLDEILQSERIDIVSPFYSGWALNKLASKNRKSIRFITRLPSQYHAAPPMLDNDPKPLRAAKEQIGNALKIFALPTLHAKLYNSKEASWLGSANFSKNGFSGKGELMIRVSPPLQKLDEVFNCFLNNSIEIRKADLDFLISCVQEGLTKISAPAIGDIGSGDISNVSSVSYDDFLAWIATLSSSSAIYIRDRIQNKNRMSGHVYSGFYGLCAFFNTAPQLAIFLLDGNITEQEILSRLPPFVQKYGAKFGGPRGGSWNSKLSTRLGGQQSGGGAGDVVVKHLIPLVARYMRSRKLI